MLGSLRLYLLVLKMKITLTPILQVVLRVKHESSSVKGFAVGPGTEQPLGVAIRVISQDSVLPGNPSLLLLHPGHLAPKSQSGFSLC